MSDRTQTLSVGQGWRDKDSRENGDRVVFIVGLNSREAHVRNEQPPHRRSRILRLRLITRYTFVGAMGAQPEHWPMWFREGIEAHS